MDRLMEEDKVLDINTDFGIANDIGTKTLIENNEYTDEDSEVEEVYSPGYDKSNYIASTGGELTMEDDDLNCYDGYEAQIYDLPNDMQNLCDHYDIRLNSHVRK
ncbi:hypothetical protein Tco_0015061 [Tanacetum coccineum]